MKMYHGTPHGNFSKFKAFSFFTESKQYAEEYQEIGASIRSERQLINPRVITVEIEAGRSFDLRNDDEGVQIVWDEFIASGEWSVRPYLTSKSLPMGGVFEDELISFMQKRGYVNNYDIIILDEDRFKGDYRGISVVVINPDLITIID